MAVSLPARNIQDGAVARLLMAEAQGPWRSSYQEGETRISMQWMKRVLQNRLDNNPSQFLARNARSLVDIIKAKNQFEGFSDYPNYSSKLVDRLQSILDIANNPRDARGAAYAKFVQNALDVAAAATIDDPSQDEDPANDPISGWRTVGARSPGSRFVKYKDKGGNTFYTLTP
jgi:hypothetical protein